MQRRDVLQYGVGAVVGSAVSYPLSIAYQSFAAGRAKEEQIQQRIQTLQQRAALERVGIIGLGSRGKHLAETISTSLTDRFRIDYVVDVQEQELNASIVDKLREQSPGFRVGFDAEHCLADSGVTSVIIATPPHSHFSLAVRALEEGKHVYLEKPMTLHVPEARTLAALVEKQGAIVQVGTQQRSSNTFIHARSNIMTLDDIHGTICTVPKLSASIGRPGVTELLLTANGVGHGVAWERWLAPLTGIDYHPVFVHGFRAFERFSKGSITNWGAHHVDNAMALRKVDRQMPFRVACKTVTPLPASYQGYSNVGRTNPEHFEVSLSFKNPEPSNPRPVIIRVRTGEPEDEMIHLWGGYDMHVSRKGVWIGRPDKKRQSVVGQEQEAVVSHLANWYDAISAGDPGMLRSPPEQQQYPTIACLLADIAIRRGPRTDLRIDADKLRVTNDPVADEWLQRGYSG